MYMEECESSGGQFVIFILALDPELSDGSNGTEGARLAVIKSDSFS